MKLQYSIMLEKIMNAILLLICVISPSLSFLQFHHSTKTFDIYKTSYPMPTHKIRLRIIKSSLFGGIKISPFDERTSNTLNNDKSFADEEDEDEDDELDLNKENVEIVLDEMRPYLIADGGNVKLVEIEGTVVKLELEGACGTCVSSTVTMKMGLEKKLKERIPRITDVIQSQPSAPPLTAESLESVLDGVRPFLEIAGGKISVVDIKNTRGNLQPIVVLKMDGVGAALKSVKMEIIQRIQRHFMIQGLKVEYE